MTDAEQNGTLCLPAPAKRPTIDVDGSFAEVANAITAILVRAEAARRRPASDELRLDLEEIAVNARRIWRSYAVSR